MGAGASKPKTKEKKKVISLLVIGLDNSGKTTLVNTISDNDEFVVPTYGLNRVEKKWRGRDFLFLDVGGGEKIRKIWYNFIHVVHGVILVVDSTPEPDASDKLKIVKKELEGIINHEYAKGKPLLVFANKQDLKDALSPEKISEELELKNYENLFPIASNENNILQQLSPTSPTKDTLDATISSTKSVKSVRSTKSSKSTKSTKKTSSSNSSKSNEIDNKNCLCLGISALFLPGKKKHENLSKGLAWIEKKVMNNYEELSKKIEEEDKAVKEKNSKTAFVSQFDGQSREQKWEALQKMREEHDAEEAAEKEAKEKARIDFETKMKKEAEEAEEREEKERVMKIIQFEQAIQQKIEKEKEENVSVSSGTSQGRPKTPKTPASRPKTPVIDLSS